jgi:hypothetical protein
MWATAIPHEIKVLDDGYKLRSSNVCRNLNIIWYSLQLPLQFPVLFIPMVQVKFRD